MENVHFYFPLFDHFYIDIYSSLFISLLICISIRIICIQIISDLMNLSVWMDSYIRHAFGVRVYEDILRGLLEEARYKPHTVHISLLCYNPSKG